MLEHLFSGFLDVVLHASVLGLACLAIGWYRSAINDLAAPLSRLTWGAIFGAMAMIAMLQPTEPLPNLLVDVRAAMIALAAYFGGPAGGCLTALVALGTRAWIGGPMALTGMIGIGLSFLAAIIVLRCFPGRQEETGLWRWLALGFAAGICASLSSFLTFDADQAWQLVSRGLPPQLVAVSLSTIGFAQIVIRVDQARRNQVALALREQELLAANERLTALARELDQRNADYVKALEKAEAFSRAKSQFLANMSHELKTPLNAILGFSDLLAMPDGPLDGHKIIPYAADINRSGQHLLKIVDDVLSMVRIEADAIVADQEQLQLREITDDAIHSLRPLLNEKQQRVVTDIDAELQGNGDPTLLRQALIHIISNAAKFSPRGSLIRIEADQIEQDKAEIRVIDNGTGFDEVSLQDAFQPFWQRDNSNSREYGGLGLGLSIAQHFIEIQGGKISIDRASSGGACVRLQIAGAPVKAQSGA